MNVLLCDDHRLLAESLSGALQHRGDVTRVTHHPSEAVSVASEWPPDVCVMDRGFPVGDEGIAAVRDVIDVAPSVRVLILTGRADGAGARAALAAGARGFLRKDQPLGAILSAVDSVAGGLVALAPDVLRGRTPLATNVGVALTPREQQVLCLLTEGSPTRDIARRLEVSYPTARAHVQSVLGKLGVHSRLEATAVAVRRGLVLPGPVQRSGTGGRDVRSRGHRP